MPEDLNNQNSIRTPLSIFTVLRKKFSFLSQRQRISTVVAIAILVGLPMTLVAINYQQNIKSKASEAENIKLFQTSDNCTQSTSLALANELPSSFCLQIEELQW